MTRATLLHALDRPTALGPAEVRELEQLAQAFPYCQTAHLLLAKAAHDQGTMLAGQRLRRAATYAADRALLRRLIEQVEPAAVAEILIEEAEAKESVVAQETVAAPASVAVPAETAAPLPTASVEAPAASPVETPVIFSLPEPEIAAPVAVTAALIPPAEAFAEPTATPQPVLPAQIAEFLPVVEAPAEATVTPALEAAEPELPTPETVLPDSQDELPNITTAATQAGNKADLPPLVDQESAQIPADASVVEAEPDTLKEELPVAAEAEILPETEPDLPAQAPAIRTPVEVGEARFEFGLADAPAPIVPVYELPGLIDEWAAAAVTLSMGGPEMLATAAPEITPAAPAFTPSAFTGDAAVGYAFGESSRLGLSMQLLDLLTARAETAESATAVVAAAQPPAVALPPTGTFFEPDPLLLDHWTTHRPPPPALPSSLDLINNFLKRQPRLTRPGMLPPSPAVQADLSVRSTRAEPDLASETLARILVRQGKPLRAIEIYEKLMVKQPEKMAYFAAQIQSLQPPA